MSALEKIYHKSVAERFFYATLFEFLGIGMSTMLGAWVFDHGMLKTGVVTTVIAIMALCLNMLYNALFDYYLKKKGALKTRKVRLWHAIGFETTLLLMTIPFIMGYLEIGLWDALVLDSVFILFYLPYTYLFNLAYDWVRSQVIKEG